MEGCWARVNLRKQHIEWDLSAPDHIAIGNLYILNLSCKSLAFEAFNPNKLHLDALYM